MLNKVQHQGVLGARDGEADMLPFYCGMIRKQKRGMAKPTGLGMSWLWPHRKYCGYWPFHLCRMALSLSGCSIARKVFAACRHSGVACCLLLGVVHECSGSAVFGAASSRQSQSLNLLFSNSCHAFACVSSSSTVEPALPEGEADRKRERGASGSARFAAQSQCLRNLRRYRLLSVGLSAMAIGSSPRRDDRL